ncbi:MAG: CBS domain-containing protein [Bdellovibrionaceae bacterium]|nr:CBS domain-containing protein [Bdellovibrionales bacterium]MCB9083877.1 CBS domain-containing protein [Pseudobdellovibrionaceae bacterium]
MKTAKDLMTKDVFTIDAAEELADVVKDFVEHGVSTVPVLDHMGDVLGLMSEMSLVSAFIRQNLGDEKHRRVGHHSEQLADPVFVVEETPVAEVVKQLIHSPVHRVLVKNKAEKLCGIISPKDLLSFLAGEGDRMKDLRDQLDEANEKLLEMMSELEDVKSVLGQYQKLYENTPIMMHSVDQAGKIIMANKFIHNVLGYDEGEMLGKTLDDLYVKSCLHEARQGLKWIMDKGYHHNTYTSMVGKDGKKVRVDIASSALRSPKGEFIGTISVSRVIDSDNLLRALHGLLNRDKLGEEELEEFLAEIGDQKRKA